MKVPDEYAPNELITLLRADGPQLRTDYFRPEQQLHNLIDRSVGANTFRAFAQLHCKPSKMFRDWARGYFTPRRVDYLSAITTQQQYDAFLDAAVVELAQHWVRHGRKQLSFGASRKLTNLLLKRIVRFTGISSSARQVLIPFLHVPHDRFCLAAIRRSAAGGRFGAAISIPKNASMGFITSASQYDSVQKVMRHIAASANEPAISIDLLAWDRAHRIV